MLESLVKLIIKEMGSFIDILAQDAKTTLELRPLFK